ncbi:hypothetical protein [Ensifer sp. YR511]|uniref:hypothetical protein n=1 Tax=Ensifer sp. YR511 TaxID=1855294 RepID=UPI00115F9F48|nr:hypothetical protein [Ensifer sp. YR511]
MKDFKYELTGAQALGCIESLIMRVAEVFGFTFLFRQILAKGYNQACRSQETRHAGPCSVLQGRHTCQSNGVTAPSCRLLHSAASKKAARTPIRFEVQIRVSAARYGACNRRSPSATPKTCSNLRS